MIDLKELEERNKKLNELNKLIDDIYYKLCLQLKKQKRNHIITVIRKN